MDESPLSDCIGKMGNETLYHLPKMNIGDVLKGTWYDALAGDPGDSVNWATSFYKLPNLDKNLGPQPKVYSEKIKWAKRSCGDWAPYQIQYSFPYEACFDASKNNGRGEIILSPITMEKNYFYISLEASIQDYPIEKYFQRISFPKKVRFYFLVPEIEKPGSRGGNTFKNLKLLSSQESELKFEAGYQRIPIKEIDKIRKLHKVDRKKIWRPMIIVAVEILDIFESKNKDSEARTCINEISNNYDKAYYNFTFKE